MENILLVVITRIHAKSGDTGMNQPDEFVAYWGGNKEDKFLEFSSDSHKIIVINGPLFYNGANNEPEWSNAEPDRRASIFYEKIKNLFPKQKEFGVIIHQNIPVDKVIIEQMTNQIIFCKKYGKAITSNVYDKITNLAKSCSNGKIEKVKLLEEIWKFFLGDTELEAKLELLHACLTPEGAKKVTWNDNGEITITREDGTEFKCNIPGSEGKNKFDELKNKNDGPFGQEYIKALSALRDALLKEY